ncbi:MAG: RICIN domain-containing protein [Verrucomicrobiota bacterium]|nr:RICIN domain-containing protein [Verrucomicrobiota bacterium]
MKLNIPRVRMLAVLPATLLLTISAQAQIGGGWSVYTPSERFEYESNDIGHSISPPPSYFNNGYCAFTRTSKTDRFQLLTHNSNRAEIRANDDYSTGSHQFQAYILIQPPTTGETVHQIFNGPAGPWLLIKETSAYNGSLHVGGATASLATNLYGHWFRFNSINDMSDDKTYLYVNGQLVWTGTNPGGTFYTKYGTYGTHSDADTADIIFSNVVFYTGGTPTGCSPTPIVPYLQVNGGAWQQTDTATITSGQSVTFGPQPTTGGSWSWSGPNGFSSTSRQVTVNNITSSGNYTATYINSCGDSSSDTFVITVSGGGIDTTATYHIQNEASGLVLNNQGSTTDGTAITQWSSSSTSDNLKWTFILTSNGYYQINSVKSGLDAVVQSASTSQGAGIIQWSFGSAGNDQWQPQANSDGSYTFVNLHSGLVLEDPASSASTSTQMDQWGSNGGSNQKWKLLKQ